MKNNNVISRAKKVQRIGGGIANSAFSALGKVFNKVPLGTAVNSLIDALPVELHIPGYQYCGPGTKLNQRLARGDSGINKLDKACKAHDIAYSRYSDTANRSVADNTLAQQAWERVKSTDASLGERTAALAVAAAMKMKSATGSGYKKRKNNTRRQRNVKRGGNINHRRKTKRNNNRVNKKKTRMILVKSGNGLYLRPYRNA